MARRIKSLKVESGYGHREHRSKRGRRGQSQFQKALAVNFKRSREKLKIKDLEDDIKESL